MTLSNTGVMCMVHIGERSIDMGNYYVNNKTGERVLVTNQELAQKYSRFINVPIYVRRPTPTALDPATPRETAAPNANNLSNQHTPPQAETPGK